MSLDIKLENFEGPLDLLLKLIDKNKIDIYNIPISKLTDDYLYYIKNTDLSNNNNSTNITNITDNMEEISQFVLMASTLLEIKSRMLLPKVIDEDTQEDIDPREELVNKLIEYKKYKNIAEKLSNIQIFPNTVIFKEPDTIVLDTLKNSEINNTTTNIDDLLDGITLKDLYKTFEDIVKRKDLKKDKIRSKFNSVTKSLYTIDDKMLYIKDLIFLNHSIILEKIFEESSSKLEIVVTFLAMLELIKNKEIKVIQKNNFSEIILKLNKNKQK